MYFYEQLVHFHHGETMTHITIHITHVTFVIYACQPEGKDRLSQSKDN